MLNGRFKDSRAQMNRSHPKPNNGVGAGGFQGQAVIHRTKKNKCLMTSFWPCSKDGTT